jgi:hypothetical protein
VLPWNKWRHSTPLGKIESVNKGATASIAEAQKNNCGMVTALVTIGAVGVSGGRGEQKEVDKLHPFK